MYFEIIPNPKPKIIGIRNLFKNSSNKNILSSFIIISSVNHPSDYIIDYPKDIHNYRDDECSDCEVLEGAHGFFPYP